MNIKISFFYLMIIQIIPLISSAETPIWTLTGDNSESSTPANQILSYSVYGSKTATTYKVGSNYKININQVEYDINFEKIQNFFEVDTGKYYICPADDNSMIRYLDTTVSPSSITTVSPPGYFPCTSSTYNLECQYRQGAHGKYIVVIFKGCKLALSYKITTSAWSNDKVSERMIFKIGISNNWERMCVIEKQDTKIQTKIHTKIHMTFYTFKESDGEGGLGTHVGRSEQLMSYDSSIKYDFAFLPKQYQCEVYIMTPTTNADNSISYQFNYYKATFNDDNYNQWVFTSSSTTTLPFSFNEGYTIKEIHFINNSPYYCYILETNASKKQYWGMGDLYTDKIIFNSDTEVSSLSLIEDSETKRTSRSFIVNTLSGTTKTICPFSTLSNHICNDCSTHLVLDSDTGNVCKTAQPSNSATTQTITGNFYAICNDNYSYDSSDNSCKTCADLSGKYILIPDNK